MVRALILLFLGVVLAGVWVFAPIFDRLAPTALDRPGTAERALASHRVLLVSIDGLAPWVLEQVPTPFLDRLAAEGTSAKRAQTVVPSVTLTSHVSMLSGLSPDEHGIFFNRYQPWREIEVPTVFSHCREVGLRCGLFAGKRKFAHLAEQEAGVARYAFEDTAAGVFESAAEWVEKADPDLVVVHLAEVDLIGHAEGWGSDAQASAIREIDDGLRIFVEAWTRRSTRTPVVLVTSDHGGHGTRHHEDRPENRQIPWLLWGAEMPAGPDLDGLSTRDTYAVLRALLE